MTFPSNWSLKKFEDIAEVVTGTTPSKKNPEYYGGEIPFVTPGDLNSGKPIINSPNTLTELGATDGRLLAKGTVLVCCIGATIGKTDIAGTQLTTNQQINSLVCNPEISCPEYVYQYSRTLRPLLRHMSSSTTLPIVNKSRFKKIEIPLPTLGEQRRIAAILDKADNLRQKRRRALARLDDLLQSVFLEMFGDPVTNPMGWEVRKLEDILSDKPQNGAYYPKEQYTSDGKQGIEMVHMSDVFHELIKRGNLRRVVIPEKDVEKYKLTEKDILIARRSLTYEGAAKPCRVPKSTQPLIFESSLIRITPNPKIIHPIYMYHYLANEVVRKVCVFPNVTTSTISGINQAGLKRIKVIVPDISTQHRFLKYIESHTDIRAKMLQEQEKLNTLFGALQQRAFRGEL